MFSIDAWREFKLQKDSYGRRGAALAWGGFIAVALILVYALTQ